jgi:hypothetical protein
VLREQLGEKLIAMAELDFSGAVVNRGEPDAQEKGRERREPRQRKGQRGDLRVTPWSKKPDEKTSLERPKQKRRSKGAEHAWRARDDERPSRKLRRKFHGARDDERRPQPQGKLRPGSLTDRKGRSVSVERYGEPPMREQPREESSKRPHKPSGRRRAPDRARGARPHRPRDKGKS